MIILSLSCHSRLVKSGFHLSDFLKRAALDFPERTFLVDDEVSMRFAEAAERVEGLASKLFSLGVKPGDRVLLVSENRVSLVLHLLAVARVGATFSVLSSQITVASMQQIMAQCEPVLILLSHSREDLRCCCDGSRLVWLDEPLPANSGSSKVDLPLSERGDALAFLVFTSGTTGMPRGVMLSHANVEFVTQAIQKRLRYVPEDRIGVFLPLSFDYGLYQIFYAMMCGAAVYLGRPESAGPELPKALARQAITVLPGVPTLFAGLIKMQSWRPALLPDLRVMTNTGDHLPLPHLKELQRLFPRVEIFPMYGLTECKRVSILRPEEIDRHANTVGRALDGTEVWAESPEGERLPPGGVGEFMVRGPHVGLGYWRAPEETAKRYRIQADGARLLVTGDYGSVDAEGFLQFHARSDFMIKHRGYRMSPVEIEEAACRLPQLTAAGCIKDEARDQLCLFITTHGEVLSDAELLMALAEHLERAKIPDRIIRLPELPRTANEKVDRKALRALLTAV